MSEYDAIVVGSGPNGLAGAVVLARAGLRVHVIEGASALGGGTRTSALTLPGYLHDECSAVHAQVFASPFFRAFGLAHRVDFIVPEISYAHTLDHGQTGVAYRDIEWTAQDLGRDGAAWLRLFRPLLREQDAMSSLTMRPLARIPDAPIVGARLGLRVLRDVFSEGSAGFAGRIAPAMLAGVAGHLANRMPSLGSSAGGLALAVQAHGGGWAIPRGGSASIAMAMIDDVIAHGGSFETGRWITSLDEIAGAPITLLDVSARGLLKIAGGRLPARYASALHSFRYGNGSTKVDFALNAPVPWADDRLRSAGTVHLGGTRRQIIEAERQVSRGQHPARPYVLLSQPSLFDDTRAPAGKHTLWAYTHVPAGSDIDVSETIIDQISRVAPGFRDTIDAMSVRTAQRLEMHNPNAIGGDFGAGAADVGQLLRRPVLGNPWRTPLRGMYLASSSTSPGPGVHGMAGFQAAMTALRDVHRIRSTPALS